MEKGKTHPILIAAGAAVLLFSLLGAAALTGALPSANTAPGAGGKSVAQAAKCANCGTVEAIRAVAGDAVEKHLKKHTVWRTTVRLDDGTVRTLSQKAQPPFAVGDRVRVTGGSGLERA